MKKFLCVILCLALAVSAFAFVGCGDNKDLLDKINELEQKLEDLENNQGSGTDFSSQIKALQDTITALQNALNSSNADQETLQSTIESMQTLIDTLETSLSSSNSDIATLKLTIKSMQTLVDALEKSNSSFSDEIESLKNQLEIAQTKILLLEGKVDGDPNKVYKLGETVTYSSNGIKLFELTLDEIVYYSGIFTPQLKYTINPINIPAIKLSNFLDLKVKNIDNGIYFETTNNYPIVDIIETTKKQFICDIYSTSGVDVSFNPSNVKVFFGILTNNITTHSIIPFAIFDTSLA